jgi:hypothetical protein
MPKSALAFIIALALTGTAMAEEDTNSANVIMRGCRVSRDSAQRKAPVDYNNVIYAGICLGIVKGVAFVGGLDGSFCVPKEATHGSRCKSSCLHRPAP